MPESTVTAPKKRATRKKVAEVKPEAETVLKGFTPRTTPMVADRSIGKSLANSISSTAEIIEELAIDGKKALRVIGKACDFACVELDGMYAVSFTENLNKLVQMGHSPENANAMLIARASA